MKQLGGYMEEFSCQDGYEIWLRFIEKYKPYNINIPLFYYRQHPVSLTKNNKKILETRKKIKKVIARRKSQQLKVLGIIPVSGESIYHFGEPFQRINGHSLISYTIKAAQESELLDKVVLATDEEDVPRAPKRYLKEQANAPADNDTSRGLLLRGYVVKIMGIDQVPCLCNQPLIA